MKNKMKEMLLNCARNLCTLAVLIVPLGALSCRCMFFQPEEPENFNEFLKERKNAK